MRKRQPDMTFTEEEVYGPNDIGAFLTDDPPRVADMTFDLSETEGDGVSDGDGFLIPDDEITSLDSEPTDWGPEGGRVDPSVMLPGADVRTDTLTGWIADQADPSSFAYDPDVPGETANPRAQAMRKLRMEMLGGEDSKTGDDGYGAAVDQSARAYNSGKWARVAAAFLDPGGAAQRDAVAYDRSQQPLEAWKQQTARRDAQGSARAQQALKMQQLAQAMRQAEMRDAATQRGLDIREGQADPGSEWNQRRRGESEADWRARQQYAEEMRRGGVVHDAPFKNRNAALSSGSPASLRAIDARPMQPGAYRPVNNAGDAMAEAVLQQFEIDQEPVPRHIEAMANQLRDPNLDGQARTALRLSLQSAVDTHRARTDEGAAKIGAARRTENIPQTLAQINKVRELIGSEGDIPGMSRADKLGRAVLGDSIGQAITGPEGRRVQNQVDLLKDQLKRLQSGMATTAREDALFERVLGTDLLASPDDFRAALQDLQDVLADRDAAIIQEAGPQAARVFSQRRNSAMNAAPGMQPGTNTPTNARTVVKRQRNTATGQVRVVYSDGTSEIVDGS